MMETINVIICSQDLINYFQVKVAFISVAFLSDKKNESMFLYLNNTS